MASEASPLIADAGTRPEDGQGNQASIRGLFRRGILIGAVSLLALVGTLIASFLIQRHYQDELLRTRRFVQTARLTQAVTLLRAESIRQFALRGDEQRLVEARRYGAALTRGLDSLDAWSSDSASRDATRRLRESTESLEDGWAEPLLTAATAARAGEPASGLASLVDGGDAGLARVRAGFEDVIQMHEARFREYTRRLRIALIGGIAVVLLEIAIIALVLWRIEKQTFDIAREMAEKNVLLQDQQVELEQQTEEAQVLTEELEQTNVELVDALRIADSSRDAALHAARQSAENLALLDAALASAPVALAFLDEDFRYRRVNPRLADMAGSSVEEMTGSPLSAVFPEHWRQAESVLRDVQLTGQPATNLVIRGIGREASTNSEWLVSYYPVRMQGSLPGIGMVATDMTEQRLLEAQLRQAQKMEAVGRLAGGVAHDFNNLLTVIIAHVGLVKESVPAEGGLREDLHEIEQAARRAAALTHQLLAFSRQQVLQPRMVDVNESIRSLEKMLHRVIGEDVTVRTTLTPHLWPVWVDPGQLDQIIMNLVVNSRDAMPEGGTLTIATRNVGRPSAALGPGSHDGTDFVLIEVSDTGTGMDDQTKQQVFEPFFTTKEKGRGTGLGLSTVYGIVQQTGGQIALESRPGEGTTFRIFLPRAAGEVATESPEHSRPTGGGSESILVVEDEPAVRTLIERVLRRAGYEVFLAANGTEAIAMTEMSPRPINLLITDMVMPGMTGQQVRDAIRLRYPSARVLYMSGYTHDDIIRRGLGQVGQAFMQKPFNASKLLERVREVLDSPLSMTGEHPLPAA